MRPGRSLNRKSTITAPASLASASTSLGVAMEPPSLGGRREPTARWPRRGYTRVNPALPDGLGALRLVCGPSKDSSRLSSTREERSCHVERVQGLRDAGEPARTGHRGDPGAGL